MAHIGKVLFQNKVPLVCVLVVKILYNICMSKQRPKATINIHTVIACVGKVMDPKRGTKIQNIAESFFLDGVEMLFFVN